VLAAQLVGIADRNRGDGDSEDFGCLLNRAQAVPAGVVRRILVGDAWGQRGFGGPKRTAASPSITKDVFQLRSAASVISGNRPLQCKRLTIVLSLGLA